MDKYLIRTTKGQSVREPNNEHSTSGIDKNASKNGTENCLAKEKSGANPVSTLISTLGQELPSSSEDMPSRPINLIDEYIEESNEFPDTFSTSTATKDICVKNLPPINNESKKTATSTNFKCNKCLRFFHRNKENCVQCKVCAQFPEIVKLHYKNQKLPAITSENGTKYLERVVKDHLNSNMHKDCYKAFQQSKLTAVEVIQKTAIGRFIHQGNLDLANRVGKLMIYAYGGAKKITLSGNTFPARVVTGNIAENFDINNFSLKDYDQNLQYVNPTSLKEFLECIVKCHRSELEDKLSKSLALSLRCYGSVDRTQIDKIYTMAKTLSETGSEELHFLGAAEPEKRGATGLLEAVKNGCNSTLGISSSNVFKKTSSLVTDGTSVNSGDKAGLWTLFQNYLRALALDDEDALQIPPLLKIWCAAHRSELAWKSMTKSVAEVKKIICEASSISSFFHKSGTRTKELKQIAQEKKLQLVTLPNLFDIRWTEFTSVLLNSMLTSWHALTYYFNQSKEVEAKGFYKFLTDKHNLELLSFLADISEVFSRFQKKLQKNDTTLLDVMQYVEQVCNKIKSLSESHLLGGWVSSLEEKMTFINNEYKLHEFTLEVSKRRSKTHNLYVSEKRDINAIKNEVTQSLINFTENRFAADEEMVASLKRFIDFDKSVDLKQIHSCIASDLDISALDLEYSEILEIDVVQNLKNLPLVEKIKNLIALQEYPTITVIFARIAAAKPHSADVERLISCSHILKSADRSLLSIETENLYLYIYFNMPPLELWDPRPAISTWLEAKKRRHASSEKSKEQQWFNGIFKRSVKRPISDEDDDKKKQKYQKKSVSEYDST